MFFILKNPDDSIADMFDADRHVKPPAGIIITDGDAATIAAHPLGHAPFDYIAGAVVLNADRLAGLVLPSNRQAKIKDIRREAMRRIGAIVPGLASYQQLDVIIECVQANMMSLPTPGSDMDRVKDIYVYGRTKINQAKTATQAQLDSYNPVTDTGWPA